MNYKLLCGDCSEILKTLPDQSVHCCITSPPYFGLRDYGTAEWEGGDPNCKHKKNPPAFSERALAKSTIGAAASTGHAQEGYKSVCGKCGAIRIDSQIGLEQTPEQYVEKLVSIFREVKRVLRDDGTLWLNLGDSYNGNDNNRTGNHGYKDGRTNRDKRFAVGGIEELKPKDLIGVPWRVAFALQADGWWLRSDIIWHKPNPMPESVNDRPTKEHEYIFLLAKSGKAQFWVHRDKGLINRVYEKPAPDYRWIDNLDKSETDIEPANWRKELIEGTENKKRWSRRNLWEGSDYYYDNEAILVPAKYDGRKDTKFKGSIKYDADTLARVGGERWPNKKNGMPMRSKRTVWTVNTKPFKEAHFAVFPPKLITPCVLAGCPKDGTVLDPFNGAGTTGVVALKYGRNYIGIDLNPEYIEMSRKRIEKANQQMGLL
ncbi:MAG TPA: site-specific DNA-methyltransferase [archaeon]|nr:site-specific DNA-methyltransferase [archaeon]